MTREIHKPKGNGKFLSLLRNFLRNRKQRAILNGQIHLEPILMLVFPKSGPLLFLIDINDLSDNLQYNPKLFGDKTSLFSTVKVPDVTVKT